MTFKIALLLFVFATVALLSCSDGSELKNGMIGSKETAYIIDEEIKLIRKGIIETSQLNQMIKEEGYDYDINLLNPAENVQFYLNAKENALNIGVYASDLNYLFTYEKDELRLKYIDALFKLAYDLDVEDAFEKEKFKELISGDKLSSAKKVEILNLILKEAEEKINNEERGQLVALIIAGSWIEGMYINTCLAKKAWPNELIAEEMWQHFLGFHKVQLLLEHFKNYAPCADLLVELGKIEPKVNAVVVGKIPVMKAELNSINKKLTEIRSSIINPNI